MKILSIFPDIEIFPDEPNTFVPFLSFPDSSVVRNGNPVFLPDFDSEFSCSIFLAMKINRLGKSISQKFASRYFTEIAPVVTITAINTLEFLRDNGLPWSAAMGFDKSVAVGDFIPYDEAEAARNMIVDFFPDARHIDTTPPLNIPIPIPPKVELEKTVSLTSRYNALKMGDLILFPLDFPSLAIRIDSLISVDINDKNLLKIPVK